MTWWSAELRAMADPAPVGQKEREAWWHGGRPLRSLGVSPGSGWSLFIELDRRDSVQHDFDSWHAPVDRAFVLAKWGAAALEGVSPSEHLAVGLDEG